MKAGFVTSLDVGGITDDDLLIANVLSDFDMNVEPVFWEKDAPRQDGVLVIRSPWNYHLMPEKFLAWVDMAAASSHVFNAPDIVRWNAHKRYLLDLERAGIPVVPTVLCGKHERWDLAAVMAERDWSDVVIKPAVSASSYMTGIVTASALDARHKSALEGRVLEDGQHLLERILETRDALIQPFIPEILQRGERCLVFIDGQFSHAVQKSPFTNAPGGGQLVNAEAGEVAIGRRALSTLPAVPLYARVDLLRDTDGDDRLMELELIDPELYMRFDEAAPRRFASALRQRCP